MSTYRWEPSQIVVNQDDEVTLEILGVNGAEHPSTLDGYDINFTVKRGELTTVTLRPLLPLPRRRKSGREARSRLETFDTLEASAAGWTVNRKRVHRI